MSRHKIMKAGSFPGIKEDLSTTKNLDRVTVIEKEDKLYALLLDGATPCGLEVYEGSTEDFVDYLMKGFERAVIDTDSNPALSEVLGTAFGFVHSKFVEVIETLSPPEYALPSASLVALRLTPEKIELAGIGDAGVVGRIKFGSFSTTFRYLKDEVLESVDSVNLSKLRNILRECGDLKVARRSILKDICETRKKYHNTENGYKVLTPSAKSLSSVKFWEFDLPPEAEGEVVLYSDGVEILFPLVGGEEGLLRLLKLLPLKEVYNLAKSVALNDLVLSIPRFKVLDDFSVVYVAF